jgi:phosphoserine phosphatase
MPKKILAVFDLDGTLTGGSSVEHSFIQYLVRTRRISATGILQTLNYYLRNVFQDPVQAVKRNKMYLKGMSIAEVDRWVSEFMDSHGDRLLLPGAVSLIDRHRTFGHTLVLITGSLDILVKKLPINNFFDIVYATRLGTCDNT